MLINRAPKFGNDIDYIDSIVASILNDFYKIVKEESKKFDWLKLNPGIGTFESYAKFGNSVGASADGRKARGPLASNYSPSIGLDKNGPTAAIKSATRSDLSKYMAGCPIDLSINVNEVSGKAGIEKLKSLIKSFKELGGQIMTLTISSKEVYRDAQIHPERHRGLRVRLGGFSSYFITLPKEHQDIMIRRLSHTG